MKKKEFQSELEQPVWAVVSFHQVEAADLTYAQATERIAEQGTASGLFIVTNDVADRYSKEPFAEVADGSHQ